MTAPLNYLIAEISIIFYSLLLVFKEHIYILILPAILHLNRITCNIEKINKDIIPNLTILTAYILLFIGLAVTKNFTVFGVLFGLLQYTSYIHHEKISNTKYKWYDPLLDIPMIVISFYIANIGVQENKLILAPVLGDFVFHILEIAKWSN